MEEISDGGGTSYLRLECGDYWWFYRDTLVVRGAHSAMWLSAKMAGGRMEGNVLFNDTLNTFYSRLYGVGRMVKDHSDSEKGKMLPPHGILFPISGKGSFIYTIPQTG